VCSGKEDRANLCVISGGTSGIGRIVVTRLLAERPDHQIILIARPSPRINQLCTLPGARERLSIVSGDLTSLRSIANACDQIRGMLGSDRISALGLNAGVQVVSGNASSADGLELSFAVNFLAHFLIVERLKHLLRPAGRIILTSSEVHDPNAFCLMGIARARWQDPLMLADPRRSQDHIASPVDRGEARYCASKLLGLMYVRHLARALPEVGVLAFNPSVVPGTEIGRDRNSLQQLGWKYVMPLLTPILPGTRSLRKSASDLLWLMTEADGRSLSGHYVNGRVAQPGSEESRDEAKMARVVEVGHSPLATMLMVGAGAGQPIGARLEDRSRNSGNNVVSDDTNADEPGPEGEEETGGLLLPCQPDNRARVRSVDQRLNPRA
jgi:NAD(P)-dependent dehydrogenase (short-subunit alcohol dehydrogenase family)